MTIVSITDVPAPETTPVSGTTWTESWARAGAANARAAKKFKKYLMVVFPLGDSDLYSKGAWSEYYSELHLRDRNKITFKIQSWIKNQLNPRS